MRYKYTLRKYLVTFTRMLFSELTINILPLLTYLLTCVCEVVG